MQNHAWDCYRMHNPGNSMIHTTRNIKLLDRMYYKTLRFHTSEYLKTLETGNGKHDEYHIEVEHIT